MTTLPISVTDDAPASDGRSSLALAVAASVTSLLAVVTGFALVALSLLGVASVPLSWGAGACVAGWGVAAVVRERARAAAARPAADAPA